MSLWCTGLSQWLSPSLSFCLPFPWPWSIVISMVLIAGIQIYHLFKTTPDVTNICKSNKLNNNQKNCVPPCTTRPQMKGLFYSCLVRAAKQVKIRNRADISSLTFLVNLITEWINFSPLKYYRCISVNFKAFYCLWFILTLRKLSIVCRKLLFMLKYIEVLPEKNAMKSFFLPKAPGSDDFMGWNTYNVKGEVYKSFQKG